MKSKLLSRYIRYYIFMFLSPSIVLCLFLYFGVLDNLKSELNKNIYEDLKLLSSTIDDEIDQINNTATQIQLSKLFSNYTYDKDPIRSREMIDTLNMFTSINPFISSTMVYYFDQPYLFSDSSTLSQDFFPRYYKFKDFSENVLMDMIRETQYNRLYGPVDRIDSVGLVTPVFLYLCPIKSSGIQTGTIMFLIEQESLFGLYQKEASRLKRNFFMLSTGDSLVYEYSPANEEKMSVLHPELFDLLSQNVSEKQVEFESEKYFFHRIDSVDKELIYVSLTPVSLIQSSIRSIYIILIIMLVLLIVLGIGISIFFSWKTYQPILQLKKISQAISDDDDENGELPFIRETLTRLISENKSLVSNISLSRKIKKRDLIFQLLKGSYPDESLIVKRGNELSFIKPDHSYGAGIIQLRNRQIEVSGDLIQQVESLSPASLKMNILMREAFKESTYHIVISTTGEDPSEKKLLELKQYIEEYMGSISLSIGSFLPRFQELYRSFLEAQVCQEYGYIGNPADLIYYPEIPIKKNFETESYSPSQLYVLRQSIKNMDHDAFVASINGFKTMIQENPYQIHFVKALTFDMKNTLYLGVKDLEKIYNIPSALFQEIEALQKEETFYLFCEKMISYFRKLNSLIMDANKKAVPENQHEYKVYMKKNFKDPNLSLESMASDFNMSTAGFSRSFKKNVHIGFMEYLSFLRIEESKKKLVQPDMVLKDIAESVGYQNVPSYIRRFRQREGITPGEYRKMHKDLQQ